MPFSRQSLLRLPDMSLEGSVTWDWLEEGGVGWCGIRGRSAPLLAAVVIGGHRLLVLPPGAHFHVLVPKSR